LLSGLRVKVTTSDAVLRFAEIAMARLEACLSVGNGGAWKERPLVLKGGNVFNFLVPGQRKVGETSG
jgi:hypothetical protein